MTWTSQLHPFILHLIGQLPETGNSARSHSLFVVSECMSIIDWTTLLIRGVSFQRLRIPVNRIADCWFLRPSDNELQFSPTWESNSLATRICPSYRKCLWGAQLFGRHENVSLEIGSNQIQLTGILNYFKQKYIAAQVSMLTIRLSRLIKEHCTF